MRILKVSELAKRTPLTIENKESLLAAADKMNRESVGLLVVTENEKVVGVLSERDIIKAIASGHGMDTEVRRMCAKKVLSVPSSSDPLEAAAIMHKNRIRHVVIIDRGELKGVISIRDLLGEKQVLRSIVESREGWL